MDKYDIGITLIAIEASDMNARNRWNYMAVQHQAQTSQQYLELKQIDNIINKHLKKSQASPPKKGFFRKLIDLLFKP